MADTTDITIIGGGPTGLFAAFYAGVRGMSCRIIDSLPELGGQLTALYPEKYIYDVGGHPKILARELAAKLVDQAMQFEPQVVLDQEVARLERNGTGFVVHAREGVFPTRSLVVAGGKGAFEPKTLRVPGFKELLHRGVDYAVRDPEIYRGKRVVVVGGGDSALDWSLILKDRCAELTLVHRREGFRAHENTVALMQRACDDGEMKLRTFHEVREVHGNGSVERITLFDNRTDDETVVEADALLAFLGFKPDLGPIRDWGLELDRNRIVVSQLMETSVPGIWAAGDIVQYEGKLDLIATGFAEAAIAVNNAVHYVNPDARVKPGHSTSMAVFKDK